MKYLFTLLVALFLHHLTLAQQGITMCQPSSSTQNFAQLASNAAFRDSHPLPGSYRQEDALGKMISFSTNSGAEGSGYYIAPDNPSDKYLLVIHEWWGLNDYVKTESDKLFKELEDVHILALDIYDGKVATTREEAQQYMQGVSDERAKSIIEGAIAYAGNKAQIATIGWCFGGGWSLQSTILAGKQAAGCVMFYGMPVDDPKQIQKIEADVLGIFAKQDGWITPEVAHRFENKMKDAGKNITVKIYDAGHGFANPTSNSYQQEAAQEANKIALSFLKKHLQ